MKISLDWPLINELLLNSSISYKAIHLCRCLVKRIVGEAGTSRTPGEVFDQASYLHKGHQGQRMSNLELFLFPEDRRSKYNQKKNTFPINKELLNEEQLVKGMNIRDQAYIQQTKLCYFK